MSLNTLCGVIRSEWRRYFMLTTSHFGEKSEIFRQKYNIFRQKFLKNGQKSKRFGEKPKSLIFNRGVIRSFWHAKML